MEISGSGSPATDASVFVWCRSNSSPTRCTYHSIISRGVSRNRRASSLFHAFRFFDRMAGNVVDSAAFLVANSSRTA